MTRSGVGWRLGIPLLLFSCAQAGIGTKGGVVELETLPADPIAFVYLEPEKARDLAERMEKRSEQSDGSNPGVARLDQLAKLLRSQSDLLAGELLGHPSLLDPKTAEMKPLETVPKGSRPLEWSKDHTRLLFAGPRFDVFQVSELNVVTGEVRTFTQGAEDHPGGSLAPDGSLAFSQLVGITGPRPAESRIYVRNPGGGEPRAVTAGPADMAPMWSSDGVGIVYQSKAPDGAMAIAWLQPVDGTPHILARGRDPAFTHDGQWIVYSQKLASGFRLWRMRPDGSGKLAIGSAPTDIGDELHPTVSPDGRYVAYVAEKDSRRTLRIRRFDGGGDRPLFEAGDGLLPVW